MRKDPDKAVINWLTTVPSHELYLSVLTLGELRKGIEKLSQGAKKNTLRLWLEHDLIQLYGTHILAIDSVVADRWGYVLATISRPLPVIDLLLASTALTHNLKLVTRNVRDFDIPGLEIVNPFLV
jgi:predicted nucleic acid-binding protein